MLFLPTENKATAIPAKKNIVNISRCDNNVLVLRNEGHL